MAVPSSPSVHARNRYTDSFQSKIFEPMPQKKEGGLGLGNPAGRRRDQTTSEMFGEELDKDLHAMPKTFAPKDFDYTAKQQKAQFLSSEVLPRSNYPAGARPADMPAHDLHKYHCDAAPDVPIDPMVRRQNELSSELFGRETPICEASDLHDASRKLTPSDFKWFSHPQAVEDTRKPNGVTHKDRAFNEKSSTVFDNQPTYGQVQVDYRARDEEAAGDNMRKANVYYSDLFGRAPPTEMPTGDKRHKNYSGAEHMITVHGDWTDSKTEIIRGSGGACSGVEPAERKRGEFNSTRLFDSEPPQMHTGLEPVTHDNSHKLKHRIGGTTQQIHQAHLQSSISGQDFYDEAQKSKAWEVVELHVAGLALETDETYVRSLCQGFDLHIVKVQVEMDPVRNYCKGRAKIMLRYNPERDAVHGLVGFLEGQKLRVQM